MRQPGRQPKDLVAYKLVDEYEVVEWHPTPDGTGQPTQVHLLLELPQLGTAVVRIKSAAALNQLCEVLQKHGRQVWPEK
jgi:hypothetical protein